MSSLLKLCLVKNTPLIYQFRAGVGFVPYKRHQSDGNFPDHHPAFVLPPLEAPELNGDVIPHLSRAKVGHCAL